VKAIDKRNLYLLDYAIYPNRYLKRKTAVSPNVIPHKNHKMIDVKTRL
jgi:hypothetical protein